MGDFLWKHRIGLAYFVILSMWFGWVVLSIRLILWLGPKL